MATSEFFCNNTSPKMKHKHRSQSVKPFAREHPGQPRRDLLPHGRAALRCLFSTERWKLMSLFFKRLFISTFRENFSWITLNGPTRLLYSVGFIPTQQKDMEQHVVRCPLPEWWESGSGGTLSVDNWGNLPEGRKFWITTRMIHLFKNKVNIAKNIV